MKSKKKNKKKIGTFDVFILFLMFLTDICLLASCYITQNQQYMLASLLCLQAVFVVLFTLAYRHRGRRRYLSFSFNELNSLTGEEFEELLAVYFRKMGYSVRTTPVSGDFGADLIVCGHGEKIVVQAKRYRNTVGISAVQEVIGAREYYHSKKAMVVTNSKFTAAAKELANKTNVILWDGTDVAKMIKNKGHRTQI